MIKFIITKWLKFKKIIEFEKDIALLTLHKIELELNKRNVEGLITMHNDDIKAQEGEIQELQLVIDNGDTSKEARAAVDNAKQQLEGLRNTIALNLQPALLKLKQDIAKDINDIRGKTVVKNEFWEKA